MGATMITERGSKGRRGRDCSGFVQENQLQLHMYGPWATQCVPKMCLLWKITCNWLPEKSENYQKVDTYNIGKVEGHFNLGISLKQEVPGWVLGT